MRRQVLTLLAGTGLAQLVSLCAIPVLTRFYSPESFGLLGLFMGCVSVLGNVATLRYELAILLPEEQRDAAAVFAVCLPVVMLVALATLLGVAFGREPLAAALGQPQLAPLLWWLPLSVLAFGTFQALNFWATRAAHFREVGSMQVLRSVAAAIIQLGGAAAGAAAWFLVAGQTGAHTIAALEWLRRTWTRDAAVLKPGFEPARMRAAAHRFRGFPLQGSPQVLINSISQTLPLFLLGMLFSPQIAGFYVLAQRVLEAPSQLLSSSFRQALMPRYARAIASGSRLAPEFARTTRFLFVLGLPALPLLYFFGEQLFAMAFGAEWQTAGTFAGWLVLVLVLDLATPPATSLLVALERQRLQLVFEALTLSGRAVAIVAGGLRQDPVFAIAAFALIGASVNALLVAVTYVLLRRRDAGLAAA
jgi:lipopolysaccharide exporter